MLNELRVNLAKTSDLTQLRTMNSMVIARIKQIRSLESSAAKAIFTIGDKVQWDGKRGPNGGTIIKINNKNIKVQTDNGIWNVAPTFLRLV